MLFPLFSTIKLWNSVSGLLFGAVGYLDSVEKGEEKDRRLPRVLQPYSFDHFLING